MISRKLAVWLSVLAIAGLFGAATATASVIINEIDYDQPSTDTAEWIELYNPDAVPQPLVGLDLLLVSASGCGAYKTVPLDAFTIPPFGFIVIGNHPCAITTGGFAASNAIQNGTPDDAAIVDRNSGSTIDSVEYENGGPSVCGYASTAATDSSSDPTGSIQRCGSGWIYDPVHTPCAPNNCPPVSVDESTWGGVKSHYR